MKTYEEERNERFIDFCEDFPESLFTVADVKLWTLEITDWSKSYFEKVIAEKDERSEFRHQMALGYAAELGSCQAELEFANKKLASRDAMIEKLETALSMNLENSECRADEDCDHCFGIQALAELAQWKKENGV